MPTILDRHTVVHLGTDLSLAPLPVGPDFWEHAAGQPELDDGRILSVVGYDATWTWRERHPVGDELALVLRGAVVLELEEGAASRRMALEAGQCGIIPAGAWHRAVMERPCRLLFVTPTPARTEQRTA
jgi:mannose-6-phosphate isomerase-like protein (cupin superfamily)